MSKQQPPTYSDGDDLPPPYTPSASSSSHYIPRLSNIYSQYGTSESAEDHVLSSLIDSIDDFISSLPQLRPTPRLAEGILVPEAVVSSKWALAEEADKHQREFKKVLRVSIRQKALGGKKSKPAQDVSTASSGKRGEFGDWGRYDDEVDSNPDVYTALWWSDEDLTNELVKQLRPILAQIEVSRSAEPNVKASAEEVTFRSENEMGIWESKTGWCIVVRVSPPQSR